MFFLLLLNLSLPAQSGPPTLWSPQEADSWSATDARGRTLPDGTETPEPRTDRYVGIFYFLWMGAHGYDDHRPPLADEGVQPKLAKDTLSPFDITALVTADPTAPAYGPDKAFHHWGEPYFGYYLSDDEWVIAKHAQLLSDAGVDVVVFDVTNSLIYLPQALTVCRVFSRLRQLGWATPGVAFLTNSNHVKTTERLYERFYQPQLYPELWFTWHGKPLLMGNPEGLSDTLLDFFSIRRSWAWTEDQKWYGNGMDKWPWIDHHPQGYGWHESPEIPEQIAVAAAQHPVSNIGRSFHDGRQPHPDSIDSGAGHCFAEQWDRALEVDPEFVFVTGWNEWIAMRFTDGRTKQFLGRPISEGETFFVDQYDAEFSRDIEPVRGGFQDNYYYQMVENIRRFKGSRTPPVATDTARIAADGVFEDWSTVTARYYDHSGDILPRDHPGYGRIDRYRDTSGRYDLLEARVAETREELSFYLRVNPLRPLKTAPEPSPAVWPEELVLYLHTGASTDNSPFGFGYRVHRKADTSVPRLERRTAGRWQAVAGLDYGISGSELEVVLPLEVFPEEITHVEFKWADNVRAGNDPMQFYDRGDAAPNARFVYRYQLLRK